MENQNNFRTNDLKLFSFIKTVSPEAFIGTNRDINNNKVAFIFKNSKKLTQQIENYWKGEQFLLSPLQMAMNFDIGKNLIFGDSRD